MAPQRATYRLGPAHVPWVLHLFLIACSTRVSGFSLSTTTQQIEVTIPPILPTDVDNVGTYPSPLHKIHVVSLLSDDEVSNVLRIAVNHAESTGCWDNPDTERHQSYSTCDFSLLDDCPDLQEYLAEIQFDHRMFGELSRLYDVSKEDMSYIDLFCAHYQTRTESAPNSMDRLEEHRDGSMLSFTLTLSDPDSFEGGGTYFDSLRDVSSHEGVLEHGVIRPKRAGDAVLHTGKALHGAKAITRGSRTVLVGFVDVAMWWERPGALSAACRDWGRMDVAAARCRRQLEMCKNGQRGWAMENAKWLPSGNGVVGKSSLTSFCPAFPSVVARAKPDFQRRKRLEAEDELLRKFLLSHDEITKGVASDDVTIL